VNVELIDETGRFRSPDVVLAALAALGTELGAEARSVTVVLVDDDTIAARNVADRGVAGPTDVLAYPLHEPGDAGMPSVPHLGDALISLDTAERQARDHGHDLQTEVLVLAAHALQHLLGFDHPDAAGWAPFLAAQARVVALAQEITGGG
jgi:probable rRNA maturation factor